MVVLVAALVAMVFATAVVRPYGLPEVLVAVPAAAFLVALGVVPPSEVDGVVSELGPTLFFLATILVFAHLADSHGVFRWIADVLRVGCRGRPRTLFLASFLACAATTSALSLDAAVVLLTPAVLMTAHTMPVSARPAGYTSAHLANSASLLMPISNLTNLLAFTATGVGFVRFTAVMALPWLTALAVEFVGLRWFFARELVPSPATMSPAPTRRVPAPRFALTVIALTLTGFAMSGVVGVKPVWAAVVGTVALAVPPLRRSRIQPRTLLLSADPGFLVFVPALGIVVAPLNPDPPSLIQR